MPARRGRAGARRPWRRRGRAHDGGHHRAHRQPGSGGVVHVDGIESRLTTPFTDALVQYVSGASSAPPWLRKLPWTPTCGTTDERREDERAPADALQRLPGGRRDVGEEAGDRVHLDRARQGEERPGAARAARRAPAPPARRGSPGRSTGCPSPAGSPAMTSAAMTVNGRRSGANAPRMRLVASPSASRLTAENTSAAVCGASRPRGRITCARSTGYEYPPPTSVCRPAPWRTDVSAPTSYGLPPLLSRTAAPQ